ncbi:MAG: PhoU domain protein [Candidatus Bathyarchaeota archaeon BA2]|nr:MAG: PhoU domain protein [Candidatus Bathyarchaeota archaeon BA2]
MVFPVETEERVKRRALSVCQDHLRSVMDVSRKISQMVDCFVKGDKKLARELFADVKKSEEEVDVARRAVSLELAEIGAILMSREDFLRFTNLTSEIADFYEGIAFRLLEIMERGWRVSTDIKEGLTKLSSAVFETVSKLRETAMTLNYGASKTLEKAREVEMAEKIVDDLYRELEVKIVNSDMDIPAMLLLRDVAQILEDTADKAEDASDTARILAFTI